ncbi:MAG TPA: DUF4169 family protein [Polyangiaceae bacterium]|nr:DUF4169 family protein [Polyangiaceae bacterium]
MSNVVNLNKFKKKKAKAERVKQAETNRRLHGRTLSERARDALQKKQLERGVDGARLESSAETPTQSEATPDAPAESED